MKKPLLENIYLSLPVFIQNILVSIKGYQLNRVRVKGKYRNYKEAIHARKNWTEEEFEEYQLEQVNRIVKLAIENTDYYHQMFSGKVEMLNSIGEISKFPVLEKQLILANYEAFISKLEKNKKTLTVHTTGTTGSPLAISCDNDSRQLNYAYFDEFLSSVGLRPDCRHIVIGGRILMNQDANSPPFWRYSAFQKSLLMSSYHLSDENLESYVRKIETFRPEYIESYPSSIYRIATYILQEGLNLECKAIVTSAETLSQEQRDVIEDAFHCRVYDQYGSAEMCVFVAQCKKGIYHVRPDYGLLEILDDQGKTVPVGELGNVVCTGFINTAFPLIRYSLGDTAAFGSPCNCGLHTPTLKIINGRKDDVIVTADGRHVGRLSPVLKGFPILASQYVQREVGKVSLSLEPGNQFHSGMLLKIELELRKRLGEDMKIDIDVVDEIPRGPGGKLRSVISYVS